MDGGDIAGVQPPPPPPVSADPPVLLLVLVFAVLWNAKPIFKPWVTIFPNGPSPPARRVLF